MDIFDVENTMMYDGSAVRSYFSARSPCFDMTLDCYPFVDGSYEFSVERFACTSLDTAYCNNEISSTTTVVAPLNILDCPTEKTEIVSPSAELFVERIGNVVKARLDVEEMKGWFTDVVFCIPADTPMKGCILDVDNLNCPYRGCFDTPEYYLDKRVTFLSGGNYTGAITVQEYQVELARGYENYAGDMCEDVNDVDWISFDPRPLLPEYEGEVGVLDIKYTIPVCGSSRRLIDQIKKFKARRLIQPVRKIGEFSL